jgi:superoxide dismutase, Fe-Mn family
MMTRRHAMKTTALAATAVATVRGTFAQPTPAAVPATPGGPFTLPPLPYAFDALEPHIDARTMEIHHDRHHKAYVDNLNKAIAEFPDIRNLFAYPSSDVFLQALLENLNSNRLNSVPEKVRTAVRNQGGGHYNHSLFWQMMKKGGTADPTSELDHAINTDFGSLNAFKQQFTEAATKIFGSGWAWLSLDGKQLKIETTPNQDTPLSAGRKPLLGLDVWEHAYYLKYQNKRADYIAAWWNVANWDFVTERYIKLKA